MIHLTDMVCNAQVVHTGESATSRYFLFDSSKMVEIERKSWEL